MRWQFVVICALWGVALTAGRYLDRQDLIKPVTTPPMILPIDPIVAEEPVLPVMKLAPTRVLRSVAYTDDLEDRPSVTISQGTVVGSVVGDNEYFEFHGIPYADSTSGAHRFKAPLPPPFFQDTFVANRKNIKCVRALGVGYEGTEDCLVANIFTPSLGTESQLPVMVWIKGKEFDNVYEHELSFRNFVEREVIVVSLNYRESVLGFLCLGTETAPGNAGLKDIIAGLRWVKENIAQFGGNPNDITLFGHGSGAAAVDLVTLSPMGNGLVDKAIAQSGNAMAPWAVSRDNLEYALQVAEALGHEVTNIEELSNIFERTSIAALMGVINELDLTENALAFAPCVERSDLEGVEPFLIKTPAEILTDGDFLSIPFITGFVDNEGTIRAEKALGNGWLERMEDSFAKFLQSDLKFESDDERNTVAQEIRRFYFEDDTIDVSTFSEYITYHGETMVLVSSIREVRARALASSANSYLYIFSYKGNLGEAFTGPIELETAAHSEELAYLFYEAPEESPPNQRDFLVAEILIERWTNFAKTGIPSSDISEEIWRPLTNNDIVYLRVLSSDEITESVDIIGINPHPNTMNFWDEIYEKYFLDAESQWDLTQRDDDDNSDEVSGEGSGEGNSGEDNSGEGSGEGNSGEDNSGDGSQEGSGEGNSGEDNNEEDDGNSASTAVGYTFMIVTLFTLLSQFHSAQLIL